MKKGIITVSFLLIAIMASAQVFNTGQTLRKKTFSLGIEPVVMIDGPSDGFNLFVHGGVGLKKGVDFGVKFGLGDENYFGGDVEFALGRNFSLSAGAHNFGDFGLDGTFNIVFPIKSDARIYTGLDLDAVFTEDKDGDTETQFPVWIPIGVEIGLKSNMAFLFEAEIGVTDEAYHVIGGGLNFYF